MLARVAPCDVYTTASANGFSLRPRKWQLTLAQRTLRDLPLPTLTDHWTAVPSADISLRLSKSLTREDSIATGILLSLVACVQCYLSCYNFWCKIIIVKFITIIAKFIFYRQSWSRFTLIEPSLQSLRQSCDYYFNVRNIILIHWPHWVLISNKNVFLKLNYLSIL